MQTRVTLEETGKCHQLCAQEEEEMSLGSHTWFCIWTLLSSVCGTLTS